MLMTCAGKEVHHVDQHLIFHSGTAKAVVNGKEDTVGPGDLVIVPAGAEHNCQSACRRAGRKLML